jgi:hypothetical protein
MTLRLLLLLSSLAVCGPVAALDLSDHWWSSERAGRGIMLEQRGERAYAVIYDFRADGTPVWYLAPQLTVTRTTPDGLPTLTGALVRMFHNGDGATPPLDADQVGEFTLTAESAATARIVYTVAGVATTASIRRLDYADTRPDGDFAATIAFDPNRGLTPLPGADVVVTTRWSASTTAAGEFRLSSETTTDAGIVRCTYAGIDGKPIYTQAGRIGTIRAASLCNGVAGSLVLSNMEFTANGFAARIDETGARRIVDGRLAAVRLITAIVP